MIRMVQSVSAAQAKSYYSDALLKSDYYLEDQELGGNFQGRLASRLGLQGRATREDFFALCENRHPSTGKPLTPRTKANRTTGYDVNFHVPKSVSLVHVLSKDDHILEAFRGSVAETMADIERDSKARVRRGKTYADRSTGELLWMDFIHQTARPVEGHHPDPHMHAHCYVFNATYDPDEQRIKAGQFRDIKRDMPYYQALFHKRLSDKLIDLGYDVRRTKKSFEIEGVPQRALDHFSKRTNEIGQIAKEKGITDAKALDELGARTRSKKQKGLSMVELKANWREQIAALGMSETEGGKSIRFGAAKEEKTGISKASLDHAVKHHFDKASVVPERRLLATLYTQSIGHRSATIEEANTLFLSSPSLLRVEEHGQVLCTTRAVLSEEKRMVALARSGIGKLTPLYAEPPKVKLDGAQRKAVEHVLTTPDRVSIIRGAAGSGKTTLMVEAVTWMERKGKHVTVVAPTSIASRDVLRGEGFEKADTVAALLLNKQLQEGLKDGVLWVDEAGMLGTSDMTALLNLATKNNARVILGGDTRQHSSVQRGDALRILNTVGKIRTAEVSKIYRQKNAEHRDAVGMLAKGDVRQGFDKLDRMGAIVEIDREQPNAKLVDDYLDAVKRKKSVLVVCPTNAHRRGLTDDIRVRLREAGRLGKKEIKADRLQNLHLTAAEKEDWQNYKPGQIVQFTQHAPDIKRGSQWVIDSASDAQVLIKDERTGTTVQLPQGRSSAFDVLERSEIALAKGDAVTITRNSYDRDKRRMDNGQMFEVRAVRKDGRIELQSKTSKQVYHVSREFGHIDHAHCVTSYASQGKTVDEVLIAQPEATFSATNAKQFYVSASRSRERIRIYTDDKEGLLDHAQRLGDRTSALEIAHLIEHQEHVMHKQREDRSAPEPHREPEPTRELVSHSRKDRDYEPRL
ncbi:MAG: relaxase domain-containing protein [Flavobacteriales bacterium]|jgi:conjugative relaxase-like TrwC/TraI family protein|nr:relaxase domain-containing protein [Flavobacteriales bacterium]